MPVNLTEMWTVAKRLRERSAALSKSLEGAQVSFDWNRPLLEQMPGAYESKAAALLEAAADELDTISREAAEAERLTTSWRQRVLLERVEVTDRIARLETFLLPTPPLPDVERERLKIQLCAMRTYLAVLNARIEAGFK